MTSPHGPTRSPGTAQSGATDAAKQSEFAAALTAADLEWQAVAEDDQLSDGTSDTAAQEERATLPADVQPTDDGHGDQPGRQPRPASSPIR